MSINKKEKEGYIEVTGGKVWYKIVGNEKGIPLIVLHGGPGHPHDSLEPLEDLKNEREIIFYDQLGCGNSERPDNINLWTVERFVEELGQIIKSLKLDKFHLYGHSWGSGLAASFALTQPKGLISLILADPHLSSHLWKKDAKRLIKQLPKNAQQVLKKHNDSKVLNSQQFKNASNEYYNRFVHRLDRTPEAINRARKKCNNDIYTYMWGPTEFATTGTLKNFDVTARLSEITIPVLLICGRFDEATPETTKYYKGLFPNARMKIFENSAHLPHWTDRKDLIKTVRKFLQEEKLFLSHILPHSIWHIGN